MKTPCSPANHRAIPLIAVLALLVSGCTWYFSDADPATQMLIYEAFYGWPSNDDWEYGTNSDSGSAQVVAGRMEVYGPQCWLRTIDAFGSDLTVLIEWSVTNGDVGSQVVPAANEDYADYTVSLDELGLAVKLCLYAPTDSGGYEDTLYVVDLLGQELAAPVTVESTGATRGTLKVRLSPTGDSVWVDVSSPELGLSLTALVADIESTQSRVTIVVSGLSLDPRSIEELFLLREPSGIGELL